MLIIISNSGVVSIYFFDAEIYIDTNFIVFWTLFYFTVLQIWNIGLSYFWNSGSFNYIWNEMFADIYRSMTEWERIQQLPQSLRPTDALDMFCFY